MKPGTILILNGASSAGKSTIVQAWQTQSQRPFLDAGIDKFLWMLPKRYLNPPLWQDVYEYTWTDGELAIQAGPLGHRLISGMHRSIVALARAGNHVIVDHVLIEPTWVQECAHLFAGLPAYFIGVRCPLPVLEQREQARKDRTLGQARAHFYRVHAHAIYDLEVDTARHDADTCVRLIQQFLATETPPTAFAQLHRQLTAAEREE